MRTAPGRSITIMSAWFLSHLQLRCLALASSDFAVAVGVVSNLLPLYSLVLVTTISTPKQAPQLYWQVPAAISLFRDKITARTPPGPEVHNRPVTITTAMRLRMSPRPHHFAHPHMPAAKYNGIRRRGHRHHEGAGRANRGRHHQQQRMPKWEASSRLSLC